MAQLQLSAIRDRVSQNIAEPISVTGWFTPTAVNGWINAGLETVFQKFVSINPDYFGVNLNFVNYALNVQEYSLATLNPFEVRYVEVTDRGFPTYLNRIEFDERNLYPYGGEPHSFYTKVDYTGTSPFISIGFVPTPNRIGSFTPPPINYPNATGNVTVFYIARPKILVADTDTTDVTPDFMEMVILWATILALRSDQRASQEWQNEFNFRMANMLRLSGVGRAGGAHYVHYVGDY